MLNSVLCHRCGSRIKIKQFKSIILPERRVQTFSHQLPHTIPSDCTGTRSLKQRKKEARHWENPFWRLFAITLLKISVKLCLQTSLVTLGKLCHFFTLLFPTADVRTVVHQYIPGVQWQLQIWLKACKTHELCNTNIQINKTNGILYQYLKLLQAITTVTARSGRITDFPMFTATPTQDPQEEGKDYSWVHWLVFILHHRILEQLFPK